MNKVRCAILWIVAAGAVLGCDPQTAGPEQGGGDCSGGKCDWVGNKTEGEPCDITAWFDECSQDLELLCRPSRQELGELEARCQPLGEAGDFCAGDEHCVDGTLCRGTDHYVDGDVQTAGRCKVSDLGATCEADDDCDAVDVCRPSRQDLGELELRCQDIGDAGAPCAADDDCVMGTFCRGADRTSDGEVRTAGKCGTL